MACSVRRGRPRIEPFAEGLFAFAQAAGVKLTTTVESAFDGEDETKEGAI